MAKEFIRTLTLIILLSSLNIVCLSQNNDKSLILTLSIDQDTIYPDESVFLSFSISTDSWLPHKVIMNPDNLDVINTKKQILSRHGIYLCIIHEDDIYEEPLPIIVNRRNKPLKDWISRSHPLILKQNLNCPMNRLFNSKMFEESTEENFFTLQNNNYGKYDFQGVFITNTNDTIVSNVIKVIFLPSNKILLE